MHTVEYKDCNDNGDTGEGTEVKENASDSEWNDDFDDNDFDIDIFDFKSMLDNIDLEIWLEMPDTNSENGNE